jgi:two-component system sensor histidine kinase KdpD
MTDARPTPKEMLERVAAERVAKGDHSGRGRLRVFFGYAAGVGKTYAMLKAAHQAKAEGIDVVAGYVEPHARPETQVLLDGLERLAPRPVSHQGAMLYEFDLDAALVRRPQRLLVDELAHTNAPGSRHTKRWQDVEELLASGVDIDTTLNVQHVETVSDLVTRVTGAPVRETVPDRLLDDGAELVMVDLPPEDLLERLRHGKVYQPDQAGVALQRFFKRENLVALRELALREVTERVHDEVEAARRATAPGASWATRELLVACVGPSPTSARVVRATKRLADRLDADWVAVHLATTSAAPTAAETDLVESHLALAERLGGEAHRLVTIDPAGELARFAQRRGATKIVLGKGEAKVSAWWRRPNDFAQRLVAVSGDLDVVLVRGVGEPTRSVRRREPARWQGYAVALGLLAVATTVASVFHAFGFSEANVVMAYLLAVVATAVLGGSGPAVFASVAGVLVFDVLFTQPYYRVRVSDWEYLVTFGVMLVVGLAVSTLAARLSRQARAARDSQHRSDALYQMSRRLAGLSEPLRVASEAERAFSDLLGVYAVVFLPDEAGKVLPALNDPRSFASSAAEYAAAQWVLDYNQPAGAGTDTLAASAALYLPLAAPSGAVGVIGITPQGEWSPAERALAEALATQVALALERSRLESQASESRLEVETEKLRSSLLGAVSHDIRTPLAGIAGAASTLAASWGVLDATGRDEMLGTIRDESQRLSDLVENLLRMTRLVSGGVKPDLDWHPIDDVIGSTLNRIEGRLQGRSVNVLVAPEVTLAKIDAVLVEQSLVNLLENAIRYAPGDEAIVVEAIREASGVTIRVLDRGPGFAPGDAPRVFEIFYRGVDRRSDERGSGVGLAICRAVAELHGGRVEASNRLGGGASVSMWLPLGGDPPTATAEPSTEPSGAGAVVR